MNTILVLVAAEREGRMVHRGHDSFQAEADTARLHGRRERVAFKGHGERRWKAGCARVFEEGKAFLVLISGLPSGCGLVENRPEGMCAADFTRDGQIPANQSRHTVEFLILASIDHGAHNDGRLAGEPIQQHLPTGNEKILRS